MYCKNCGSALSGEKTCPNCGIRRGEGNNYCPDCGEAINPESVKCVFCEAKIKTKAPGAKSRKIAGLLGLFFGWAGAHNFYLGFFSKGIIQLMLSLTTCGFLPAISAIWGIYEGAMILKGDISTDAYGVELY